MLDWYPGSLIFPSLLLLNSLAAHCSANSFELAAGPKEDPTIIRRDLHAVHAVYKFEEDSGLFPGGGFPNGITAAAKAGKDILDGVNVSAPTGHPC
jgi:hypothetical protein